MIPALWRLPLALLLVSGSHAAAQTYTVESITTGNVGTVAAAASGVTAFQIYNTTTTVSGGGQYITGATNSPVVTIKCVNGIGAANSCASNSARVTVARTGVNAGRGQTITTIGAQAVSPATIPSGTSYSTATLDFTLGGWSAAGNRQFLLGVWLPVLGDDASTSTLARSQIRVAVAKNPSVPSGGTTANVQATVRKALRVTKLSDLAFGTIVRPATGSGTVTIDASTGARTAGGAAPPVLVAGAAGRAAFTITGQSGSVFTISGPSTFDITSGSNVLTVQLVPTASGAQTLAGGTFSLGVGGTITIASTTPAGSYAGNAILTLAYN